MKTMKKYLISAMVLCLSPLLTAQSIDVKVDPEITIAPDIAIDVSTIANQAVAEVMNNFDFEFEFGDDGDYTKGKYQTESQEVEIPLSRPGERGVLKVDSHNGKITIKGYDGATVKVKITKYSKKVNKEKEGGMRLVSSGGFNFEASEYNNRVEVENEGWGNRADFEIMVPTNFDIEAESYNNGDIFISNVAGEFDIESYNGPITLEGISGSASASTYNGDVKVSFAELKADMPMTFNTYNGDVDISVPAGSKFSTKMRTNRDIFTDFESFSLSAPKPTRKENEGGRGYSVKYENWVSGDLNGGGSEVTMKTRNGNIYIRKM